MRTAFWRDELAHLVAATSASETSRSACSTRGGRRAPPAAPRARAASTLPWPRPDVKIGASSERADREQLRRRGRRCRRAGSSSGLTTPKNEVTRGSGTETASPSRRRSAPLPRAARCSSLSAGPDVATEAAPAGRRADRPARRRRAATGARDACPAGQPSRKRSVFSVCCAALLGDRQLRARGRELPDGLLLLGTGSDTAAIERLHQRERFLLALDRVA